MQFALNLVSFPVQLLVAGSGSGNETCLDGVNAIL